VTLLRVSSHFTRPRLDWIGSAAQGRLQQEVVWILFQLLRHREMPLQIDREYDAPTIADVPAAIRSADAWLREEQRRLRSSDIGFTPKTSIDFRTMRKGPARFPLIARTVPSASPTRSRTRPCAVRIGRDKRHQITGRSARPIGMSASTTGQSEMSAAHTRAIAHTARKASGPGPIDLWSLACTTPAKSKERRRAPPFRSSPAHREPCERAGCP
jgi:hypothetical protein